jgi:hypothetical protein
MVDEIIAALNDRSPAFPSSVATAPPVDREKLDRLMRLASAWAGTAQHAEVRAGDGETATTVRITGRSGNLTLSLKTDQENVLVQKFGVDLAL